MRRAALAVLTAVLLAGCGNDTLTANAYRVRADRSCLSYEDALDRLPAAQSRTERQTMRAARKSVAIARRFRGEIGGLKPPGALSAAHKRLIADLDRPAPANATPAKALDRARALRRDYGALGARACAGAMDRSIQRSEASFGVPDSGP